MRNLSFKIILLILASIIIPISSQAKAPPPNPEGRLTTSRIHFRSGDVTILPMYFSFLDQVSQILFDNPDMKVRIDGHADSLESETDNLKLSEARADNVMKYLLSKGVASERLTTKGFGDSHPITDSATKENRVKNRRVEFTIIRQEHSGSVKEIKGKLINKPWQYLSEEERQVNRNYLSEKLQNLSKEERLSFLLHLLDDQRLCFVLRDVLKEIGLLSIERLREIAADRNRGIRIRSAALAVLAKLKDRQTIPLIEDDPILMIHTPAYGCIGGETYKFHENFLELSMVGMNEAERITFLSEKLKAGEQTSVVVTKFISLYKKAVPELIRIVSNKENTFLARNDALFALKQIGDKAAVPVAMNILKDEEETDSLRGLAAATLGSAGDGSVIPTLEHISRTWKPKVKGIYRVDKDAKKAIELIKERIEVKRQLEEGNGVSP